MLLQNKLLHLLSIFNLNKTLAATVFVSAVFSCGVTKTAHLDRKNSEDQTPQIPNADETGTGDQAISGNSDSKDDGNSDTNSSGVDSTNDGSNNPQDGSEMDGTNTDGGEDPIVPNEWEQLRSQPLYIYVANRSSNSISLFKLKKDNSDVILEKTINTDAPPGQIYINRSHSNLYLTSSSSKFKISNFEISKSSGDLTLKNSLNIDYGSTYIALNKQESHIFYASYASSKRDITKFSG